MLRPLPRGLNALALPLFAAFERAECLQRAGPRGDRPGAGARARVHRLRPAQPVQPAPAV